MERGYCPHCKKVVKAKRSDLDIGLIILLAIFTAGVGVIIYLLIFYSRNEHDLCEHCNSKLRAIPTNYYEDSRVSAVSQQNPYKISSKSDDFEEEEIKSIKKQYCPYCGVQIASNAGKCPNCNCKL